jgi:hypothetical protein
MPRLKILLVRVSHTIAAIANTEAQTLSWRGKPGTYLRENMSYNPSADRETIYFEEVPPPISKPDAVNHPSHYTSHPSGVECITITEHYNFCIGNGMKYIWRAGLKGDAGMDNLEKEIEDCEKAVWYITRHINNLKKRKDV